MLTFKMHFSRMNAIAREVRQTAKKGEVWLANEVLKDTRPYVP